MVGLVCKLRGGEKVCANQESGVRTAKGASLGAGVLANAPMTDYPGGVFRLHPFKVHGILDYGERLYARDDRNSATFRGGQVLPGARNGGDGHRGGYGLR